MEPQQPQRLGKYEIVAKIGQGAMGDVYKAHDPILNRDVAIKTMSATIGADEELRKRFHREAQAAARLNHPGIVSVYDFGEEAGKIYMAMELLEGKDLRALIGKVPMAIDRKVDIILQICDAMSFAHAKEVIHRDLKPGNIHIQPNGQIKIMDFGLARLASSEMTRTGMVMGTPNYMSPEQVRGERADARSDVFSLGAVFYEILANRKPFEADSLHAVLFQVMQGEPEPLENLVPDLPQEIVEVIRSAMSKDPVQRFNNAGEMADALRQLTGQMSQPATLMGEATIVSNEPVASGPGSRAPSSRPPSSVGSVALRNKPASHPPRSTVMPRQQRTLAGQARTQIPQGVGAADATALAPPPVSPAERIPTGPPTPRRQGVSPVPIVIGAVLVLGLGAGGVMMLMRKPAPPPEATPDPAAVQALSQELIANKVQLAQKSLDDKNWELALSEAQAVLKQDASNASAQQVMGKAQTMIKQVEETVGRGRTALNGGNMDAVATALEQLLALDPDNPAAAEFTLRLNKGFRSQAESARGAMTQAEDAATKARATGQADFKAAGDLGNAGEELFKKGQYAEAARKYLEARDAYGRAQRAAERPIPTPPPATQAPRPTPPPVTQPPLTQPPATQPAPTTLPPVTQPPMTQPPATQPPVTMPPVAGEEAAVRKIVSDYQRAIETKDVGLLKALKPDLSGKEEQALKASGSKEIQMDIATVRMDAGKATVMVLRKDRATDGKEYQLQQTLMLEKTSRGWIIKRIAAQQIGQ